MSVELTLEDAIKYKKMFSEEAVRNSRQLISFWHGIGS